MNFDQVLLVITVYDLMVSFWKVYNSMRTELPWFTGEAID